VTPIAPNPNRTRSKARSLGAFFRERFRTSNRFQKERFGNDCAGIARRDGPDPVEQDLWSFAALTDEPPQEIAETGHPEVCDRAPTTKFAGMAVSRGRQSRASECNPGPEGSRLLQTPNCGLTLSNRHGSPFAAIRPRMITR
jgi:hypothetical protein